MSSTALWITENVTAPVEGALLKVGINSAFKAGVVAGLLTAGVYWVVKPSSAFDANTGQARPWALLDIPEGNQTAPTFVPWYVGSLIVGYSVNLII